MDESQLSRLPAELRNRFYELVLRQGSPIIICDAANDHSIHEAHFFGTPLADSRPLALTATCKDIRSESLQLSYAINSFVFKCGYTSNKTLLPSHFTKQIGPLNTRVLRSIVLDLGRLSFASRSTVAELMEIQQFSHTHSHFDVQCEATIHLEYEPEGYKAAFSAREILAFLVGTGGMAKAETVEGRVQRYHWIGMAILRYQLEQTQDTLRLRQGAEGKDW
ncbi:hypothetical protein LTR48_006465 [Friedmanniomyces endolithicus]|uniref:Uncharacterized protein n=1 Tax=Rachicladosporium monterosium TaxID=1507873 RepID=A0ABR0KYX9_9PEZI|nr:hypothetical protein LTR48_006465 [Friedmanniomyces endolithicus]KAK5140885.1 hypothetical protein LTR32_006430 [Rachicladosporium monterosium]